MVLTVSRANLFRCNLGQLAHSDLECLGTFVNQKMIKFQIVNFFLL